MKKKILMTIGTMSVAAILGLGFAQSVTVSAEPDLSIEEVRDKVKKQYPGTIRELELVDNANEPIYEIEIEMDGKAFALEVDGNSGEVLNLKEKLVEENKNGTASIDRYTKVDDKGLSIEEKEDNVKRVNAPVREEEAEEEEQEKVEKQTVKEEKSRVKENNKSKNDSGKKAIINREKAIQIAQKQFFGELDDIELDDDDGHLIYEVEIESNRGEAEIEIDAYTGKVLVVDLDLND